MSSKSRLWALVAEGDAPTGTIAAEVGQVADLPRRSASFEAPAVRMNDLLQEVEVLETRGRVGQVDVTDVTLDSREVGTGSLFCALVGSAHDGHEFAGEAAQRGAAALLVERPLPVAVPQAIVAPGEARRALAKIACALEGHPASSLTTLGVTGTNGKTSTTQLLRKIFEASGRPTQAIGTLSGSRTTPESPQLQRLLADARDRGLEVVAMEVSSHALSQHRVDGFRFSAAVFTNLGHDHLDYHRTIESYFEAKASLFSREHAELGVVNTDDPWGRRLMEISTIPMIGYSRRDVSEVE
ncbi:MAG TPA: Mur ligase family protein, partial [Acidimicrobiales bacterium]|nr:Mur ligase family protein [Acidimicrobiales bacterium]